MLLYNLGYFAVVVTKLLRIKQAYKLIKIKSNK